MDELLSEREQIDAMRSWWSENGTWVVLGIVIGVGGIFGLNQYRSSQLETQVAASTLFEALAEEISNDAVEPAEALVADMVSDYPQTIYADQARLAMARLYMDQGRDEDAAASLRALLDSEGDAQMKQVARLRLAKVMLYQDRAADVLALLEGQTESGFSAKYFEAIGDAHTQLGNYAEAEEAYLAAVGDPLAAQVVDTALLQMKISDLPDGLNAGEVITPEGAGAAIDQAMDAADTAGEAIGDMAEEIVDDMTDDMNDDEAETEE